MSIVKGCNVLAALALVLSGGLVLASLGGLFIDQDFWLTRLGTLAGGLALAAVATFALLRPAQQQLKKARRYFDRLGHVSLAEFSPETLGAKVPSLPKDHPLRGVADRLTELLAGAAALAPR